MKNRFFRLFLIIMIVSAPVYISCGDLFKEDEGEPKEPDPKEPEETALYVSPRNFTFAADDTHAQYANISTNASDWFFDTNSDWLALTKLVETLMIAPQSVNTSNQPRTATIIITAGNTESVSINVTQEAAEQYNEIVNSNYSAWGTPLLVAPYSFSGKLWVNEDFNGKYYSITNWANKIMIFLDVQNDKIFLDTRTVIFEYDDLNWCMGVGYYIGDTFYAQPVSYQHEIQYDSYNNTLDFSGYVEGYDAVFGLIGRDNSTGEVQSFSGDTFYSEVSLQLYPQSKSGETQGNGKYLRPQKRL
ncbi:MAG: BACON domain-containing protein [Marinilabiliaceae bacterium]|nr:BACON domain-containing protein [Marinilabiliaceae bacterium]